MLPLLVVTAGIIVYSNSFSGVFLFDDYKTIIGVSSIRHVFPWALTWRCITDLTFKLTYAIGGWNVAYYHAGNILIHILASLVLYGIVRRTLLMPAFFQKCEHAAPWLAFFTAVIWVVHPLQTESVTYLCQRYESMMGFFLLLTLYCFIRGIESDSRYKRLWHDLSLAACILGMGTKEVMVTAPVIVLLYDYFYVAGSVKEIIHLRWRFHLAMFCSLGVLFMTIFRTYLDFTVGGSIMFTRMSSWTYLLTEAEVIVHYLWLVFIPYSLCFDYSWPPVESVLNVIPQGGLILGLLVLTIWAILQRKALGFPFAWFFVILAPTSSFMPLGDMAFEHRMYLPLAGIVVFMVVSCYYGLQKIQLYNKRHFLTIASLITVSMVIIFFGILTIRRNTVYQSSEIMWRDIVKKRPQSIRAATNLARELLHTERNSEAEQVLRALLRKLDITDRTGGTSAYVIAPSILMHYLSSAHDRLGIALLCSGKTGEAVLHFKKALEVRRNDGFARHNLGLALLISGKTNQALFELEQVQVGDEGQERTHALKALIFTKQGKFADAVQSYRKVLEIDPSSLSARCELAWILATSPDDKNRNGIEALKLAREICDSTLHASYHALDVLAAAYADNGRFEDAKRTAEKAKAIAMQKMLSEKDNKMSVGLFQKEDKIEVVVQGIENRIKLYEQRKPYRISR